MDIVFVCGCCGQRLVIEGAGAGQVIDCPKCGKSLVVPYTSELPAEAPKPPQASPSLPETKPASRQAFDPVDDLDTKQPTQPIPLKELRKLDKDITFDCHECGQRLVVDKTGANRIVSCPKCGTSLVVPNVRSR
jgi:DNA-directed RNA polymerase subunit RPC12/RpoP